jgi:chaperonin GroES
MARNLRPIQDRIILKPIPLEEKINGIFLPETSQEKPQLGTVLAVGNGVVENGVRRPLDIAVGDNVLYGKYSGTEIELDGNKVLILREEEILSVVEGEAPAA